MPIAMFGKIKLHIKLELCEVLLFPRNCEYVYEDRDLLDADAVLFYLHKVRIHNHYTCSS